MKRKKEIIDYIKPKKFSRERFEKAAKAVRIDMDWSELNDWDNISLEEKVELIRGWIDETHTKTKMRNLSS